MKKQMIGLLFSSIALQLLISPTVTARDMWLREIAPGESAWVTLTPELVGVFKAVEEPGRNRPALAEVKELVEAGGRIFLRGLCDQAVEEAVDYFNEGKQPSRIDGAIGKYQQDLVEGRAVSYPFQEETDGVIDQVVESTDHQQRVFVKPPRHDPRCTEVKCLCVKRDACIGRNLKVGKKLCVGGPVQLCARAKGCPPIFAKGTDECGIKQNRAAVKFCCDPQFSLSINNGDQVEIGPLSIDSQLRSPQLCVKAGSVDAGKAEARVDGFAETAGPGLINTNLLQTVNVSVSFPVCFCCPFQCDVNVLASFENGAGKFISPVAGSDNLIFVYGPIITVECASRKGAIIRMTLPFVSFSSTAPVDAAAAQRDIIQQIGVKANEIMRDTCINLIAQGVAVCR